MRDDELPGLSEIWCSKLRQELTQQPSHNVVYGRMCCIARVPYPSTSNGDPITDLLSTVLLRRRRLRGLDHPNHLRGPSTGRPGRVGSPWPAWSSWTTSSRIRPRTRASRRPGPVSASGFATGITGDAGGRWPDLLLRNSFDAPLTV